MNKVSNLNQALCFSLITQQRTLDLMFTESNNLFPWILGLQWIIFEKSTPPFNFLLNEGKLAFKVLKNKFRAKAIDANITTNGYMLKAIYTAIQEISKPSSKAKTWQNKTLSTDSMHLLTGRPAEKSKHNTNTSRCNTKANKTVTEGMESNSFKISNTSANLCDESFAAEKKPIPLAIKEDYSSQQTSRFNYPSNNESIYSSNKNTERRVDVQKEYESLLNNYNQKQKDAAREKKDMQAKMQSMAKEKEMLQKKYEEEIKKLTEANKLFTTHKYSSLSKENANPNCRKSISYSKTTDFDYIKGDFFRKKICDILKVEEKTNDKTIYESIIKGQKCAQAMYSVKEQLGDLKLRWEDTMETAAENDRSIKEVWPHFINVMKVQGERLADYAQKYYECSHSPLDSIND